MPETSADSPTISLRGAGLPKHDREAWKKFVTQHHDVDKLHRAATITEPTELSHFPNSALYKSIEEFAIEPALLPAELQEVVPWMVDHFNKLAVKEGLVEEGTIIENEILFIPKEDYDLASPGTKAFFSQATKKIYVAESRLKSAKGTLGKLVAIGHELRHRVAKIHVDVAILRDRTSGGAGDYQLGLLAQLDRMQPAEWKATERQFLEELFTNGWSVDHLSEYIPPNVIQSYIDEFARKQQKDPATVTLNEALDAEGFLHGTLATLYYIWSGYKAVIPDFEELIIAVRCGKPKSVNSLVQAIRTGFGKEGLLALVYAKYSSFSQHTEVYSTLFAQQELKHHMQVLRMLIEERNSAVWGKLAHPRLRPILARVVKPDPKTAELQVQLAKEEKLLLETDRKLKIALQRMLVEGGYKGKDISDSDE